MQHGQQHTGPGFAGPKVNRSIAMFLLGAQLLVGLGMFGHTHVVALRLDSDPILSTHECGPQERHIPIDSIHPCVLCWQLHQRVSLPVEYANAAMLLAAAADRSDLSVSPVIPCDHFFPQKRGPPAVS
jgi:hypothetical protein